MTEPATKRFHLPPEPEPCSESEEILEELRAVAERAIQARRKPVPVTRAPATPAPEESPKRVRYTYD